LEYTYGTTRRRNGSGGKAGGVTDPATAVLEEFQRTALVHIDDLYRFAYRLAGNRATAEDLVQEACLQAWRSFHRFERGTNCRAWLYRILYFVWSHERRRLMRRPLVVFDSAVVDTDTREYDPPTPDRVTEREILDALEKLPDALQEIVLLSDVEGLTYRELADLLDIPMGTVMSRLNRARGLLRRGLASYAATHGFVGRTPRERRAR